VCVTVGISTF